jgi:hypothetical protein
MNLTSIVRTAAASAVAIAAVTAVAVPEGFAQEPNSAQSSPVQAVGGAAQQITLTMGKGGLFKTSAPYAKLSVTDEKIVEVTPQSDREFLFNPRGIGSTNVFVFDDKNVLIARVDVNVVDRMAKAHEVREQTYDEVPGRVRIYGHIYNSEQKKDGELIMPTFYHCNPTNCEVETEAQISVRNSPETMAATPKDGASPDGEKSQ